MCPDQVVRCCLEHSASVAKTFLMSDCVVVEIKEPEPAVVGNPMDNSGISLDLEIALVIRDIFFHCDNLYGLKSYANCHSHSLSELSCHSHLFPFQGTVTR